MDAVYIPGLMVDDMKVNIHKIEKMDMEYIDGQMVESMMECGKMADKMV